MADRQHVRIPFGDGLDRESGNLAVESGSFFDLRNVYLRRGKAELRRGLPRVGDPYDGTDVVGIHAIRSRGVGAVLTYDNATGHVVLWIVDASGGAPVSKGVVMNTPAGGPPPRLTLADTYDRLFIAHDEPDVPSRANAVVYNAANDAFEQFIFDGTAMDIPFRGIARHLNYLVAWGWGDETTPDGPETFRISDPGAPTTFGRPHYFLMGQRGEPVVMGDTLGNVFVTRKETDIYGLYGYDVASFGVQPIDGSFGQVQSRLSVAVGSTVYFWSVAGPRRCVGDAPSQELALPLDLDGPSPDALATARDLDTGAAWYDDAHREVVFCFGRWGYVLHLEDEGNLRWSFREYAVALNCAGVLYETAVGSVFAPPDAHAEISGDPTLVDGESVSVTVDLVGTVHGGEVLEWWVETAGVWALLFTSGALASGAVTWTGTLSGLTPDDTITLAVRVKRRGLVASDYAGSDPSVWPATSRVDVIMPALAPPTITAAEWALVAGVDQLVLTLTGVDTEADVDYQVQADPGTGYEDVTVLSTDRVAGTVTVDATLYHGTLLPFKARQHMATSDSAYSAARDVFVGDRFADLTTAAGGESFLQLVLIGDTGMDVTGGVLTQWNDARPDISGVVHPVGQVTPDAGHEPDTTATPNAITMAADQYFDADVGDGDTLTGLTICAIVRCTATGLTESVWERQGPNSPDMWFSAAGHLTYDDDEIAGAVDRRTQWAFVAGTKDNASGVGRGYDGATPISNGSTAYTLSSASNSMHFFHRAEPSVTGQFEGDCCMLVIIGQQLDDAGVSDVYDAMVALAAQMGITVVN